MKARWLGLPNKELWWLLIGGEQATGPLYADVHVRAQKKGVNKVASVGHDSMGTGQ
jgi:hypothetical protein